MVKTRHQAKMDSKRSESSADNVVDDVSNNNTENSVGENTQLSADSSVVPVHEDVEMTSESATETQPDLFSRFEAFLTRKFSENSQQLDKRLADNTAQLQQQLSDTTAQLDKRLADATGQIDQRLADTTSQLHKQLQEQPQLLDQRLENNNKQLHQKLSEATSLLEKKFTDMIDKKLSDHTVETDRKSLLLRNKLSLQLIR